MIEHCSCPKNRSLAEYEPGEPGLTVLHPCAGIMFAFPRVAIIGKSEGVAVPGTAICERFTCRVFRRQEQRASDYTPR